MTSSDERLLDSPPYRRFLAEAHPHLALSDERLPVPSYVAPLDVREPMLPGFFKELLALGVKLAPSQVTPRTLFLGTPFERYDQTHLLDDTEDAAALADAARRAAEQDGLELVVATCVSPTHPRLCAWLDAGFVALPSFPDTIVAVEGSSFDEHLASLPSEDRSGIRRNRRRFEQAGHRLERLHASVDVADALYGAYLPFYERASVKWLPHTREYFAQVASLDERVRLTVARNAADDIIGFLLCFEDATDDEGRRVLHAGRVGVVPDYYKKDGVYFRLLYHVLEEALSTHSTHVSLEPTAYRTKRHLGAQRRQMVNLVLAVSPSWRFVLSTCRGLGQRLLRHLDEGRTLERHY